jgi:hypothetical protein
VKGVSTLYMCADPLFNVGVLMMVTLCLTPGRH